jgi:hypothetical protein
MTRTHQQEITARILFRAIRLTKDLNEATFIVSGDYVRGNDTGDKVGEMLKVYNLKMSECMRILAFIEGKSTEL